MIQGKYRMQSGQTPAGCSDTGDKSTCRPNAAGDAGWSVLFFTGSLFQVSRIRDVKAGLYHSPIPPFHHSSFPTFQPSR